MRAWTDILLAEEVQIQVLQSVRSSTTARPDMAQWAERFDAELTDRERDQIASDPSEWDRLRQLDYLDNMCLRRLDPQNKDTTRLLYVVGHLFAILFAGVLQDDFDYAAEEPWKVFWRAVAVYNSFPDLQQALTAAADSDDWALLRDFVLSFHGVRADRV